MVHRFRGPAARLGILMRSEPRQASRQAGVGMSAARLFQREDDHRRGVAVRTTVQLELSRASSTGRAIPGPSAIRLLLLPHFIQNGLLVGFRQQIVQLRRRPSAGTAGCAAAAFSSPRAGRLSSRRCSPGSPAVPDIRPAQYRWPARSAPRHSTQSPWSPMDRDRNPTTARRPCPRPSWTCVDHMRFRDVSAFRAQPPALRVIHRQHQSREHHLRAVHLIRRGAPSIRGTDRWRPSGSPWRACWRPALLRRAWDRSSH